MRAAAVRRQAIAACDLRELTLGVVLLLKRRDSWVWRLEHTRNNMHKPPAEDMLVVVHHALDELPSAPLTVNPSLAHARGTARLASSRSISPMRLTFEKRVWSMRCVGSCWMIVSP